MRTRHVSILFGIAFSITCGVILIAASDNGTDVEMDQEIVSTLHKIVQLREQALLFAQDNHEQEITDLSGIHQARLNLSAARIRLATVEGKPDVVRQEYRRVLAIHQQQLRLIQEKLRLGS